LLREFERAPARRCRPARLLRNTSTPSPGPQQLQRGQLPAAHEALDHAARHGLDALEHVRGGEVVVEGGERGLRGESGGRRRAAALLLLVLLVGVFRRQCFLVLVGIVLVLVLLLVLLAV
jgi:hypothetical protein